VLRGFFPAHSHQAPQLCVYDRRLTIYMTIVINKQGKDDDCHLIRDTQPE
jgi:hypothetical protein